MDKKGLLFHVEAGDYFITLATVLNSITEELQKIDQVNGQEKSALIYLEESLKKARDELIFLQKNFKIKRRPLRISSLLKEQED